MSENFFTTYIAPFVPAILAFVGVVVSAFFAYKSSKTQRETAAEAASAKRARDAVADRRRTEDRLAAEQEERKYEEINRSIREIAERIEHVSNDVDIIGKRFNTMSLKVNRDFNETDESIAKIVQVLSKNARQYSIMMKMHAQTEKSFAQIMQTQAFTSVYVRDGGESLQKICAILQDIVDDEKNSTEIMKLADRYAATHRKFVNSLIDRPSSRIEFTDSSEIHQEQEEIDALWHITTPAPAQPTPSMDDFEGFLYQGP